MAPQKTYSRSDQIGEEGQRFVALNVTRLGHIWHDRRIDHGVDGSIELVDPVVRSVSNVHLMVQNKTTEGRFAAETATSFHFLLKAVDIAYWRGGSNRVIVVCSRPSTGEIWWAPVERAKPPAPGRKSWRLDFDKDSDRLDENSVGRLVSWATEGTPGGAVSGRRRRAETLQTNLLRIKELPREVFFGPTWKPSPRELGPALRKRGYRRSDWIIRGGVVYSFARPERDGLGDFLDDGYETIDTTEWAESKDLDTLSMFADLLRQALRDQEHRQLWFHPTKRLFVFRGPQDNRNAVRVKVKPNKPGRTVFQRYFKDDERTEFKDCRHYAAAIHFVRTDEGWVAEINPTYYFTFDGYRELPWGEDRVKGMKKIEKNPAVRGLVQFWAEYLGRPPELGDPYRPLLFSNLVTLGVDTGIDDRDWQATVGGTGDRVTDSGQQELWS
ncbi:MAG: DUF4365 domain-containing protein [bacterium]|nr:DUF4365 domain-containing protein [bacterium]